MDQLYATHLSKIQPHSDDKCKLFDLKNYSTGENNYPL